MTGPDYPTEAVSQQWEAVFFRLQMPRVQWFGNLLNYVSNFFLARIGTLWNRLNIESNIMKYSVKAVTQLGNLRYCEWGDGEWVETPHEEKMFETRKQAEEFAEREKLGFAYLLKMQIVEVDDD